jgi:outer membrane protein assembly factor BamB
MRRALACAAVLAGLVVAAPATADLSTYGYSNSRTGSDPAPAGVGTGSVAHMRVAWKTHLDGAINGQPLILDGVRVGQRIRDVVLVGTAHGEVAALDADSGRVLWHRRLSQRRIEPDCDASPDGHFGVTATLVADRKAGRAYAVDIDGQAWALRLGSGRVVRGWPVRVHPKGADFVWGALTLSRGWLYVPVASLCDVGHYNGGVTEISLSHPSRVRHWFTTGGTHAYAGGIWGWAGLSVDPHSGDLYAASGNSIGTASEAAGAAEAVIALSPRLSLLQENHPLHPPYEIGDRDFGTTPVLIHRVGCPAQLVAINKDGELFVYNRAHISAGPVQRLRVAASSPGSIPLYGVPAFDPATDTLVLVSPTTPPGGRLHAGVQAFALTSACGFTPRWQARFDYPDAGSDATIAGGVVFIGSGRNGWLRTYALSNGRRLWSRHLSHEAIFAAPTVDRGRLFVAGWSGYVWGIAPGR